MPLDMISAILNARQQNRVQAGGSPHGGGYAGGGGLGTTVVNQNRIGAEIDAGGIIRMLDRFGLIPRDRDTLYKMGAAMGQDLERRPPEERAKILGDPASQAYAQTYTKQGVPGWYQNKDTGLYDYAQTYADQTMTPEARGYGQTYRGTAPGREQIGAGMIGQGPMQQYRTTAGQFERAQTPTEEMQRQGLFAPRVEAETEHAKAGAIQARGMGNYYDAYADWIRAGGKDKEDPLAKESQKAALEAMKDQFKNYRSNRDNYIKRVTDQYILPYDRVATGVQFGGMALGTLEGMKEAGATVLHPSMTTVVKDFLHAGAELADLPASQAAQGMGLKSLNPWGAAAAKPTEAWNSLYTRSFDQHNQLLRSMQGMNPSFVSQAMTNQLKLMGKMDLKSDPQINYKMLTQLAMMKDVAEAAGWDQSLIKQAQRNGGWSDAQLDGLVQQIRRKRVESKGRGM